MNDDYLWSGRGTPDPDVERLGGTAAQVPSRAVGLNAGSHAPAPGSSGPARWPGPDWPRLS